MLEKDETLIDLSWIVVLVVAKIFWKLYDILLSFLLPWVLHISEWKAFSGQVLTIGINQAQVFQEIKYMGLGLESVVNWVFPWIIPDQ